MDFIETEYGLKITLSTSSYLPMINILIADPSPLFIQGIRHSISDIPDTCIAGVCHSYSSLSNTLENGKPDILMLDETLEFASVKKIDLDPIWRKLENVRIVFFYKDINLTKIRQNLSVGVSGHLLKDVSAEEVALAVETTRQGKVYIQASIREVSFENKLGLRTLKPMKTNLTRRELEIIQLIVEEYSTQEIAGKLFISVNTVESHRKNLILKLGVKNTAGIVREAIRLQLYPDLS